MKTLLVSGCSVTHGTELYNDFMHPENIKLSYSQYLADRLNCNLVNVALAGSSNEYIFHSIIDNIDKIQNSNEIHSIIVMWTGYNRLCWKKDDRHYFFFNGNAKSMKDLYNFKRQDKKINGCWLVGDNEQILNELEKYHQFFPIHYFDTNREIQKSQHYKLSLESICKIKNIKLIQLSWIEDTDIKNIGTWYKELRHPNVNEHKIIANLIYEKYYENQ